MTDNSPETLQDGIPDSGDKVAQRTAGTSPLGAEQGPTFAAADETAFSDIVEDGVALHLVDVQEPGTIFVAVAEPADDSGEAAALPGAHHCRERGEGFTEADDPCDVELVDVAAVRLNGLGPALYFLTGTVPCAPDDTVVVEMEEGLAYGVVASVMRVPLPHLEELAGEQGKICSVARKATDKDIAAAANNTAQAKEALEYCCECIRERDLDMKLVEVLILHDRSKMIFYFTAPTRIDFRELVKDLVRRYRTRIELRQIGVRHETQMVGALGNCGMVCCCRRYLRKFAPVAIKMAKEQNVFLNPVKISGICGRLLCCLAYEQEHYDEFYRSCPKLGKKYQTDAGLVRVLRASLFRESVSVLSEAGEEVEYPLAEWNALHPFRPNVPQQQAHPQKQDPQDGPLRKAGEQNSRLGQDARRPKQHTKDAATTVLRPSYPVTLAAEEPNCIVDADGDDGAGSGSELSLVQDETLTMDTFSPDMDDDESIFGLAPRRDTRSAGGKGDQDGVRPAGGHPKRQHRRKRPVS